MRPARWRASQTINHTPLTCAHFRNPAPPTDATDATDPTDRPNPDMDECRNNPCGAGAQCTNIPGGYRCSCAPGFERSPAYPAALLNTVQTSTPSSLAPELGANASVVACVDVNECAQAASGKAACGSGAQCINTPGAYFCQCPPNYTGNPKVACVDIDECASQACGPNAQCKNLAGGYKCECKAGYTGKWGAQCGP